MYPTLSYHQALVRLDLITVTLFVLAAGALAAAGRRPAMTADVPDPAGHGMVTPAGSRSGRPDGSVEQIQYVFHELHADGRHVLCEICGSA